jgi:hypothetical protein
MSKPKKNYNHLIIIGTIITLGVAVAINTPLFTQYGSGAVLGSSSFTENSAENVTISSAAGAAAGTGGTAQMGGSISIAAGTGGSSNGMGGAISINGGAKGGAGGVDGPITIGTSNTGSITLGQDNVNTTITGPVIYGSQPNLADVEGVDTSLIPSSTFIKLNPGYNNHGYDILTSGSPTSGQILILTNTHASNIAVIRADAGAPNVLTSGGADRTLSPDDTVIFIFDGTNWIEISFVGDNA